MADYTGFTEIGEAFERLADELQIRAIVHAAGEGVSVVDALIIKR